MKRLMDISLYDFHQELKQKRIIFYYSGPISQDTLEGVGSTLRRNLDYEEADNKVSMSVFSIFVEQVQNILNYSAEKLEPVGEEESELRVGVVVIGREETGDCFVCCGNQIYNKDMEALRDKIEEIRNLGQDELKSLYKKRRKMSSEENSRGAGLGLIEMARRSGKPLEYNFTKIDDEFSFFSIKVVVRG